LARCLDQNVQYAVSIRPFGNLGNYGKIETGGEAEYLKMGRKELGRIFDSPDGLQEITFE